MNITSTKLHKHTHLIYYGNMVANLAYKVCSVLDVLVWLLNFIPFTNNFILDLSMSNAINDACTQADLNCMKDHVTRASNWQYVINAAGESFPLRSQKEMITILRMYNGTNDIEGIDPTINKYIINRYKKEFMEGLRIPRRVKETGRNNPDPPHDIKIGWTQSCHLSVGFYAYYKALICFCTM